MNRAKSAYRRLAEYTKFITEDGFQRSTYWSDWWCNGNHYYTMVLEIKLPESAKDLTQLQSFGFAILIYFASFVIVGIQWNRHHHILDKVEKITNSFIWKNMIYMFFLVAVAAFYALGAFFAKRGSAGILLCADLFINRSRDALDYSKCFRWKYWVFPWWKPQSSAKLPFDSNRIDDCLDRDHFACFDLFTTNWDIFLNCITGGNLIIYCLWGRERGNWKCSVMFFFLS